jgi:hypothetical protein
MMVMIKQALIGELLDVSMLQNVQSWREFGHRLDGYQRTIMQVDGGIKNKINITFERG